MREARFTKYKERGGGGEYLKTHKCYTHTPSHQSKQSDVLASLEQLKKKSVTKNTHKKTVCIKKIGEAQRHTLEKNISLQIPKS